MENELCRLATFHNFPTDAPVYPVRLAEAGFYYEGNLDEVTCFHCNIKHKNWRQYEDPFKTHVLLSSSCSFIRQHPKVLRDKFIKEKEYRDGQVNVERKENQNETKLTNVVNCSQPSPSVEDLQKTAVSLVACNNLEPLGVTTSRPKYPSFSIQSVRLSSYKNWPSHLKQTPLDFAKAGFFYEGELDNVRCFFCAGGLKEWEPEDDPWIEHARWFPKCVFLRQCKGDKLISEVHSGILNTIKCGDSAGSCNDKTSSNEHQREAIKDDPAVLSVIEMGYSPEVVQNALSHLQSRQEYKKISSDMLLQAVWDLEDSGVEGDTDSEEKCSEHEENVVNENEMTPKEAKSIVTENQHLKEVRRCKICLDEEASIVFLPCGHLVSCASCSPALFKCPICRTHVKGTVKAILS